MAQNGKQRGQHDGQRHSGISVLRWNGSLDLVLSCAVVALAALAYMMSSDGSALRVALALTVLFFIPGYLLIEASVGPSAERRVRVMRACVAVGLSPAIVGLLALATAILPGGFRPASIVVAVTVACFVFAGLAFVRRSRADMFPHTANVPIAP